MDAPTTEANGQSTTCRQPLGIRARRCFPPPNANETMSIVGISSYRQQCSRQDSNVVCVMEEPKGLAITTLAQRNQTAGSEVLRWARRVRWVGKQTRCRIREGTWHDMPCHGGRILQLGASSSCELRLTSFSVPGRFGR